MNCFFGIELYPGESTETRWALKREVYAIVSVQFFICTASAAVIKFSIPTAKPFMDTVYGLFSLAVLIILFIILGVVMGGCSDKRPWNLLLLVLFTLDMALTTGMVSTYRKGMPMVIVAGAMTLAFLALMLYTFWAKKRSASLMTLFLFPFLICSLLEFMVIIGFGFIRVLSHMGSRQLMIYHIFWYLGALVSSGLIIVVINRLSTTSITSHDYIGAACSLFIDTIVLFCSISKRNR